MSTLIRDVYEHELDSILALNNAAGPAILALDAARLRHFFDTADYFRVAENDGNVAGFLVGFGSGSAHDSSNFAWFGERHPSFFYIDRIGVASRRRGGGVGRAFHADVQGFAEARWPLVTCEVLIEHDSDPARLFHGAFGFQEEGQHVMPENGVRASMLVKKMCSYPWIRERYGDRLPDVPWLLQPRRPRGNPAERATGT